MWFSLGSACVCACTPTCLCVSVCKHLQRFAPSRDKSSDGLPSPSLSFLLLTLLQGWLQTLSMKVNKLQCSTSQFTTTDIYIKKMHKSINRQKVSLDLLTHSHSHICFLYHVEANMMLDAQPPCLCISFHSELSHLSSSFLPCLHRFSSALSVTTISSGPSLFHT